MTVTASSCPICLQELGEISAEGLENHKAYCRARETQEVTHRKQVADILCLTEPYSFDDVARALGTTIKNDNTTKSIMFGGMLLTYTDEEQINMLMAAESSAGKSYLALEIADYFPKDDVLKLGGASPTSFMHEASTGKLATWNEESKETLVNLERKIVILLDQPHDLLLQKLRAFLSHDEKEIVYKITDRSQKSGLRTRTIRIRGFSTWVFCSAALNYDQQERTRNLQLSPDTNLEKVKSAAWLLLDRQSDRAKYRARMAADKDREKLRALVLDVKGSGLRDVTIPDSLKQEIHRQWEDAHPRMVPRHVRDLGRFLSLVKARALLNWRLRTREDDSIVATEDDYMDAWKLYSKVSVANELGIAPQVYRIFEDVIAKIGALDHGVTKREILTEYHAVYGRALQPKSLEKDVLPSLEASGLVTEQKVSGSETLYYPHPLGGHLTEVIRDTKGTDPSGDGGNAPNHTGGAVKAA